MKFTISIMFAALAVLSASVHAAPVQLSPRDCHSFPFVKTASPVTHRQLMTELGELEANGYQPDATDATYPAKLDRAEHALGVAYSDDCKPAAAMIQHKTHGF